MNNDFELTDDLSDKEIKKLMHKLRHPITKKPNPKFSKGTGNLTSLKKIFKEALRNQFIVSEVKKEQKGTKNP